MEGVRRILLWIAILAFPANTFTTFTTFAQGFTPVPDYPPRAASITIGPPDASSFARITGGSLSVPANSVVSLINLETGELATPSILDANLGVPIRNAVSVYN